MTVTNEQCSEQPRIPLMMLFGLVKPHRLPKAEPPTASLDSGRAPAQEAEGAKPRRKQPLSGDVARAFEAIQANGGRASRLELAATLGVSSDRAHTLTNNLQARGLITPVGSVRIKCGRSMTRVTVFGVVSGAEA